MYLFQSEFVEVADFESKGFRELFALERSAEDLDSCNSLMMLCIHNPQLLDRNLWFVPKLLGLVWKKNTDGKNSLTIYNQKYEGKQSIGYQMLLQAQ